MKYLAALLLVLAACSSVRALEIKGNTIVLSPEEVAACANGCTLVTARALAEMSEEEFRNLKLSDKDFRRIMGG